MVRLATINDTSEVTLIYEDAKDLFAREKTYQWKGVYPSATNFISDLENNLVVVEEQDGVVCGCATIVFTPDPNYSEIEGAWCNNEKYISIHRIATKNGHYNQGVGTALFKECEAVALKKGIKNIRIDTHELNKQMRSLLISLGYKYCGVIELKGRDDLVDKLRVAYQKELM